MKELICICEKAGNIICFTNTIVNIYFKKGIKLLLNIKSIILEGGYMKKKIIMCVATVCLVGMTSVSGSSLMDARLSGNCHYVPILEDSATGITYYGNANYRNTAAAQVSVKVYKSDGSYNSSATVNRYGWDAVSGEGGSGACQATAKIRSMVKAISTHKGKKNKNSSSWTETTTRRFDK